MLWLRACPRCQGDLFESSDEYGAFAQCFQCSYTTTLEQVAQLRHQQVLSDKGAQQRTPPRQPAWEREEVA